MLLAFPAVLVFAASQVFAAPGERWVSVCTAAGARLVPLAALPAAPDSPGDDKGDGLCAHAASTREWRAARERRGGG